jgi:small-conductance mechanosensitive channel
MIYQRFAEEGIGLAFPQRDLHLDSLKPLRIEVCSAEQSVTQKTTVQGETS